MHMNKNWWIAGMATVCIACGIARGESWRRPVQGALVGGAAGALISRSNDIDSRVAVPALAATGALAGYELDQARRRRLSRRAEAPAFTSGRTPTPEAHSPAPRHPGVTLETIELTLPNGIPATIRILKVNDRYIGPRGQIYESRPKPEVLLRDMLSAMPNKQP